MVMYIKVDVPSPFISISPLWAFELHVFPSPTKQYVPTSQQALVTHQIGVANCNVLNPIKVLIWWSCEFCVLKFCNYRGALILWRQYGFQKVNHHLNWNKYLKLHIMFCNQFWVITLLWLLIPFLQPIRSLPSKY